jgi:hypothetical protein
MITVGKENGAAAADRAVLSDWLKVKNPDSPAMVRARDHFARSRQ